MQTFSSLSFPTSSSTLSLLPTSIPLHLPTRTHPKTSSFCHLWTKIPSKTSHSSRAVLAPHSTAVAETVETSIDETELIEVGYICKVHGLQGEVRVKPNTGFPELRFAKPGRRWLKERRMGKEIIKEVELVEGRDHPGQKSWILSFDGIDTIEKATELIGSSLLVMEDDRPELDEGEFYTRDLVGMKVILKETNQFVGTVVNVFNSGGTNDLLQVELNSNEEVQDGVDTSESETGVSGHLAWVPFVEAIVPDVDMDKREMKITPPKGLLELNVRSDVRSKKERRKEEWKERKKATRNLIVAKKKLIEMEQKHIFHGLRFGEKAQRSLLADHIVGINFKLFQQAIGNFDVVSTRWYLSDFVKAYPTKLLENRMKIAEESLVSGGTNDKTSEIEGLRRKGNKIISEGKAAIVLVVDDQTDKCSVEYGEPSTEFSNISHLETLLNGDKKFVKMEGDSGVPLVMVSSSREKESFQNSFLENDYFGFDTDKVWFLEEENLPVVSSAVDEESKHKVLMKSQWEILQSPVGSGGVFSLLSSNNILEQLSDMGVEYVQICNLNQKPVLGNPLFFGFVKSRKADIGIKIHSPKDDAAEDFNVIFSIKFLKTITKQMDKLKFLAITKQNPHVEFIDKEWVEVVPSSSNSYEFHCSIYSSLSICSPDKVCAIKVSD